VGYLADNIDCNDKDVTAALSHIRLNATPGGMRSDFERLVVFLLPIDPVKKKRGGGKRNAGKTSSTAAAASGKGGGKTNNQNNAGKKVCFKPTFGEAGVEFRFYKTAEFNKLTNEQKDELCEYRKVNGNYKGTWSGNSIISKGFGRTQVTSMIKANGEDKVKELANRDPTKASLMEEFKSIISSQIVKPPAKCLKATGAKMTATPSTYDGQAIAERCVSALMEKFSSMDSKVPSKSG